MSEVIFAYWQGYTKSSEAPRSLEETPDGVDVVALAFGVIDKDDPNTITTGFLTSKWTESEIKAGISFLKGQGKKVLISLNGQPDLPNGGWPALDPTTFANNTKAFLTEWNLDGIDLDNEDNYHPGDAFANVIKALRTTLGSDAIISMPVYRGTDRDAFLSQVRDEIDYVWTMAYWNDFPGQKALLNAYQGLVGDDKAGMGVGIPGMTNPGQSTPWDAVAEMSAYTPQAGVMIWALNSSETLKWYDEIASNIPR